MGTRGSRGIKRTCVSRRTRVTRRNRGTRRTGRIKGTSGTRRTRATWFFPYYSGLSGSLGSIYQFLCVTRFPLVLRVPQVSLVLLVHLVPQRILSLTGSPGVSGSLVLIDPLLLVPLVPQRILSLETGEPGARSLVLLISLVPCFCLILLFPRFTGFHWFF